MWLGAANTKRPRVCVRTFVCDLMRTCPPQREWSPGWVSLACRDLWLGKDQCAPVSEVRGTSATLKMMVTHFSGSSSKTMCQRGEGILGQFSTSAAKLDLTATLFDCAQIEYSVNIPMKLFPWPGTVMNIPETRSCVRIQIAAMLSLSCCSSLPTLAQ